MSTMSSNSDSLSSISRNSLSLEPVVQAACFLADQVISGVLVGPFTVFAWWGAWDLLSSYVFPQRVDINGFVCAAIGNGGLMMLAFTQSQWTKYVRFDNILHWVFGYHFHTALCFFCNVCHWRGVWILLDYYTGENIISAWTTYAIGQGFLLLFRSSKNAQAPPMIIVYDRDVNFFSYSTRFRTTPRFSEKYIFDVAFTVVIIHQLVVFYWRGSWELMDLYIFPDNKTYSALVSYGIAFGLMILLCVLQPLFNFIYRRFGSAKNSYRRFLLSWLLEAITYFLSNFVNVALWRGVWLTCDIFVLPQMPNVAHGVMLAAGFVGMWVMLCGHSVAIRGCELDGETSGGEDSVCICQNLYIRGFRSVWKWTQTTTSRQDVEEQNDESTVDSWKSTRSDDARNNDLVYRF